MTNSWIPRTRIGQNPGRNFFLRPERWLGPLLLLIILGFSSIPLLMYRQSRDGGVWDYALWYRTALRYRHGEDIYPRNAMGEFEFIYPPTAAALLAPLSLGDRWR